MGLLGRLREGAGLVAQMAAAEGEATRLTGVTAAARAQRVAEGLPATAFIRSGAPDAAANAAAVESATKGLTLFDLPGIKVGDRFRIDPSSQLGGVSGVQGDAVVDAISANH
ncbi:MAG: hypothetical protein JWM98_2984, partial [Thermoleophilia bacterium]|nr:hypothetical protein [Thermoleophilia bacterium]